MNAKWYFEDVANAMEAAKEEIFITDWWFVLAYLGFDQLSPWGIPDNAAVFGGRTVWQLAVPPDGLAAHPNIVVLDSKAFSGGLAAKDHD